MPHTRQKMSYIGIPNTPEIKILIKRWHLRVTQVQMTRINDLN